MGYFVTAVLVALLVAAIWGIFNAAAKRALAASIMPEYIQYIFASRLAPNVSVMLVPSGQQFILSPDMLKPKQ